MQLTDTRCVSQGDASPSARGASPTNSPPSSSIDFDAHSSAVAEKVGEPAAAAEVKDDRTWDIASTAGVLFMCKHSDIWVSHSGQNRHIRQILCIIGSIIIARSAWIGSAIANFIAVKVILLSKIACQTSAVC